MRFDLYGKKDKFDRALKRIENWQCSRRNKEFVYRFFERCSAEGLSIVRRLKYISEVKIVINWLNKDLDKVTKDDIIKLVNKIQDNGYKCNTIKDYKISIKKLYWTLFNDHPDLKEFCDWMYDKRNNYLKATLKVNLEEKRAEGLTEEEFSRVLKQCRTIRDKCLLSFSYEAGTRPSETLNVRIKDISENGYGFRVMVSGKTGARPIFLVKSAPYLSQWLNSHPYFENKESALFVNIGNINKGKHMTIAGANKILKNTMVEAGIDKPKHLYFLRSSSVTRDNIAGMSRGAMEKKYGWISGTKVMVNYDRSVGKDYESEVKRMHGIVEVKHVEKVKRCERCGINLGYNEKFCNNCGLSKQEQEGTDKIKEFLMQPQVMEMAKAFLNGG